MKKIFTYGVLLLSVFAIYAACSTSDLSKEDGDRIEFDARYIRTGGILSGAQSPIIKIVSSKTELERIYREEYDLSAYPYLDQNTEFANAVKSYSESYFENNFLLLVSLEESSGSIRHDVEKIEADGTITINRLIPEVGTDDMAYWIILIELDNDFNPEESSSPAKADFRPTLILAEKRVS